MARIIILIAICFLVAKIYGAPKRCKEGCGVCGKTVDVRFKTIEDEEVRTQVRMAFGLDERKINGKLCVACSRALRRYKMEGKTDLNVKYFRLSLDLPFTFRIVYLFCYKAQNF